VRKLIVSNLVSLDGFLAGPKGEIDWFTGIALRLAEVKSFRSGAVLLRYEPK
jgi:hypothetical protein